MVDRTFFRERMRGNFRGDAAIVVDAGDAAFGDLAHNDGVEAPLLENGQDFMLQAVFGDQEHALLRFAEHDFVRRHAGFTLRNFGEIDFDAGAAARSHFHRGASESGCAHVLYRDDRACLHGFKAGFEQQFLHEGVADLHVRAFLLRLFGEFGGGEQRCDGIHGASLLASAEFTEESKQKRPNVQVGDPFMEKLLLEACLEAMQTGAVVAIQDMGAAGLTCSTMEMASRGGTGIEIDLAKVPQRETGMTPYEIMLSESQERMLLVAENGLEHEVLAVFKKWGLDAVVVGQVTDGGLMRVKDHGKVVAEIPAHPLAEEGPVYRRPMVAPAPRKETAADWFAFAPEGTDLTPNFLKLLASPAIACKRWITEQYDTSVRTNTLAGPGASDAAVVRIKDPKAGVVKRALALSTDGNGRWCQLNPRVGAMHAVAEAARNVACSGAHPIAATN